MWLVINFMSKWAEFDKYDTVSNHPQFLGSNIIIVEWFPVFFLLCSVEFGGGAKAVIRPMKRWKFPV